MKKIVSILSAVAMILATVFVVNIQEVKAAEKVDIHIRNGVGWESINIYNWGDDGEIAGAWPGTAMTDEGNGWFTISFEVTGKMNLVFCVDADGDGTAEAQSGDLNDVEAKNGEVWISFDNGEEAENALGAAVAGELVLLDGKPDDYVSPNVEEETEEITEEATEETQEETQEETTEEQQEEAADDETPKTGDVTNNVLLIMMLAGAVMFILSKKIIIE